jgi:hypothetical protein
LNGEVDYNTMHSVSGDSCEEIVDHLVVAFTLLRLGCKCMRPVHKCYVDGDELVFWGADEYNILEPANSSE